MTTIDDVDHARVRVSAHCGYCRRDVETDGTNRCPTCGSQTIAETRGRARAADGPLAAPPAVSATAASGAGPVRTVSLRATRKARAWISGGAELLAQLEADEARAVADFEAARASVREVRQEMAALRNVLAFVSLESVEAVSPCAAPLPARGMNGRRGGPLPAGQWSRKYAACRDCGSTGIRHKARGYCVGCYQRHGSLDTLADPPLGETS
jgi:DNA-directed RNA polymerase subunit RPC12/RpoP